jgi:hypothetical protein
MKRRTKKTTIKASFVFKRPCVCSMCQQNIKTGSPFFYFRTSEKTGRYSGWYDYSSMNICSNCLKTSIKKNNKFFRPGAFEHWLKESMAKKLMKAGKK